MVTPTEHPTVFELRSEASFEALNRQTMRDEALPLALLNGFASRWPFQFHAVRDAAAQALLALHRRDLLARPLSGYPNRRGVDRAVAAPGLRDDWPPYVAWVVYFALIVAFTREFLELKRVSPLADRIMLGALAVLTLESALYLLDPDFLVAHGIFDITDPVMTAIMLATMLGPASSLGAPASPPRRITYWLSPAPQPLYHQRCGHVRSLSIIRHHGVHLHVDRRCVESIFWRWRSVSA